jgi:hypothetical protein
MALQAEYHCNALIGHRAQESVPMPNVRLVFQLAALPVHFGTSGAAKNTSEVRKGWCPLVMRTVVGGLEVPQPKIPQTFSASHRLVQKCKIPPVVRPYSFGVDCVQICRCADACIGSICNQAQKGKTFKVRVQSELVRT